MQTFIILIVFTLLSIGIFQGTSGMNVIQLSKPVISSSVNLNEAISKRRSVRSFSSKQLNKEQISQLLWAAQGMTQSVYGYRTAPSAGALYPLEIYVADNHGVWHYVSKEHEIKLIMDKDVRKKLSNAALGQSSVEEAPVDIIIAAVYRRTTSKYGRRGIRYVHMEAGHAAQNILLEAVNLNLGAVPLGAFHDRKVRLTLHLSSNQEPLYIIPVGYKE